MILGFSDFHGDKRAVENASQVVTEQKPDLVVVAGDLANNNRETALGFLNELSRPYAPLFFVPGNLDSATLLDSPPPDNAYCIHGACRRFRGVTFLGLGGSVRGPFETPFEYEELTAKIALESSCQGLESSKLVLVTHCPPKNTKVDRTLAGIHAGSFSVRDFIETRSPDLTICGHIHEAMGVDYVGKSLVVNVGAAQQGYYGIVQFENKVRIRLSRF